MKRLFALAVCATLLLSGCTAPGTASKDTQSTASSSQSQSTKGQDSSGTSSKKPARPLGDFSTTTINGDKADTSILKGHKLTMVNVWATYCKPCLSEMPELGELSSEYADKSVQVVGIVSDVLNSDGSVSDGQLATARDVVAATKANYTHLVPSQDLRPLMAQISSVPTTFFVDESGNQVGQAFVGARSKAAWKAVIDKTLAEMSHDN